MLRSVEEVGECSVHSIHGGRLHHCQGAEMHLVAGDLCAFFRTQSDRGRVTAASGSRRQQLPTVKGNDLSADIVEKVQLSTSNFGALLRR